MASDPADSLRPGELKIQSHVKGGCHTLCLSGELDMVSAPELDSAVTLALAQAREVILDIEELTFIDSTGLRAILTCHKSCQRIDIPFRLTPGQSQARRLFEITGLLDRLPFMQDTSIGGEMDAG
jgi:anti-sigma B factor antagonist